jgi:colicin import membrane protein
MADLRESCLLFSLKRLDQERAEEDVTWRRAEAQRTAGIEAERRARREQEALMRAEEARLRAEAAARREEAARIEAIRLAAMEKARIEAEQSAKIALLAQQQEHERVLLAIGREQDQRALRRSLVAGAAMTAAILGTLALVHFAWVRPEAERTRRREAEIAASREAYVARLQAEVDRANRRADEAQRALLRAQSAEAAADEAR